MVTPLKNVKGELINTTSMGQRKKCDSPIGFGPMTSRTPLKKDGSSMNVFMDDYLKNTSKSTKKKQNFCLESAQEQFNNGHILSHKN